MSFNADRMSPPLHTRSPLGLVCLIVAAILAVSSHGFCQEETGRHAQREPSGVRLPPRSNSGEATPPSSRKTVASNGGIWTTVISLVVIVGALSVVAYWLKPYVGAARGLPIDAVELLGRRSIDQKVAIHLVRCGSRVLVLGVSAEGARTLAEITEPAEVQRLITACQVPRDGKSFANSALEAASTLSRMASFQAEETRRG